MCFFWHFSDYFSSGRGSFLVHSAPWHAESPPELRAQVLSPGRGPWYVLWGLKVASPLGEGFRARRACKPTYIIPVVYFNLWVKKMSYGSCDIYVILTVVNVARHYLVMEYFPDT